jgi:hypothetical protein
MAHELAPATPAARVLELDELVGTFDCEGEILATPFSTRRPLRRTLSSEWDLDGHWLFMRIEEVPEFGIQHPARGNWQITFDRGPARFVALWTDNLGRWSVQTSSGWEDDRLVFTGDTVVGGRPAVVRDTLVRCGRDEMRFDVDFKVDGVWTPYLESTCRRAPLGGR